MKTEGWYNEENLKWLETCSVPQSLQFMIDILPTIRNLTRFWPRNRVMEVLDIGTSSGSGANLLATLYRGELFGFSMKIDALDIQDTFKPYADAQFKDIKYYVGDINTWNAEKTWDLIICSHTIEHFTDPNPFMKTVINRARSWVVFYAPYQEIETNRHPAHLITITDKLVDFYKPIHKEILASPAWGNPKEETSRCILFVVSPQQEPISNKINPISYLTRIYQKIRKTT